MTSQFKNVTISDDSVKTHYHHGEVEILSTEEFEAAIEEITQ